MARPGRCTCWRREVWGVCVEACHFSRGIGRVCGRAGGHVSPSKVMPTTTSESAAALPQERVRQRCCLHCWPTPQLLPSCPHMLLAWLAAHFLPLTSTSGCGEPEAKMARPCRNGRAGTAEVR